MKFISRKSFAKEMEIAQIHGNESEKRGVNWMMISFAIIISTLILGIIALKILPNNVYQKIIGSANNSTTSAAQK
ncbi:MAG TPA: hypothetical protein PKY82_02475 [Pyrinomonadaceae bacterium]|nr:hypothetical protein [Pyrinomonadaceae bacterium]